MNTLQLVYVEKKTSVSGGDRRELSVCSIHPQSNAQNSPCGIISSSSATTLIIFISLLHHVIWEWVMTKTFGHVTKDDVRKFLALYGFVLAKDWYVSQKCHCVGLLTPL